MLTAEGTQTTDKTRRRFAAARDSLTPMTSHDPTALSNYFDLQSCNTTDKALESSSRARLVPSAVVGSLAPVNRRSSRSLSLWTLSMSHASAGNGPVTVFSGRLQLGY
ncbi:hypothetical protein CGLO_16724 [Colletotrichum gloeosporioides Cg-14]|uniref:Uncharacterized protein n=1 Tax=Colletotrichum gloeosporioides (strain Cg-14) TaxID=1237896 RepID=T0JYG3_COLGC|nr:hypothetical protein CGLO_16724 [Colletotrichum gloeosporioides Cg-14]